MRRVISILALSLILAPQARTAAIGPGCSAGSTRDSVTGACVSTSGWSGEIITTAYSSCRWHRLKWSEFHEITKIEPNIQISDGYKYETDDLGVYRTQPDDPTAPLERGYIRTGCANGNGDLRFWSASSIDPDPVITAVNEASKLIPLPEENVDPPPSRGSVVNFGLWLAVTPTESITATAHGRDTGVAVTATLESTTWDMGDGTEFTCDGGGTPIDEEHMDSIEPGPCGHLYEQNTPDDDPYTITVTTHWNVHWTATDGRAGTAPTIHRTNQFAYDVDEIITRGHSY